MAGPIAGSVASLIGLDLVASALGVVLGGSARAEITIDGELGSCSSDCLGHRRTWVLENLGARNMLNILGRHTPPS